MVFTEVAVFNGVVAKNKMTEYGKKALLRNTLFSKRKRLEAKVAFGHH